ncbi:hypothetical protein PMIN03_006457 [Paraphaeosphaeria minitans]
MSQRETRYQKILREQREAAAALHQAPPQPAPQPAPQHAPQEVDSDIELSELDDDDLNEMGTHQPPNNPTITPKPSNNDLTLSPHGPASVFNGSNKRKRNKDEQNRIDGGNPEPVQQSTEVVDLGNSSQESATDEQPSPKLRRIFQDGREYIEISLPSNGTTGPYNLQQLLSSQYSPIQRVIMNHLGPLEIIALGLTSSAFQDMRERLRNNDYNINLKLNLFFSDPEEFRKLLSHWQGIITGDFVYNFLGRRLYTDLDLSIDLNFIMRSDGDLDMDRFLTDEGYEPADTDTENDSWNYHKILPSGRTLYIYYDTHRFSPLYKVLRDADTTAECRFITHEKAYTLFPHFTIKKKEVYTLKAELRLDHHTFEEYAARGFEKVYTTSLSETTEAEMALPRRVTDKQTWILPLAMGGLEDLPTNPHIEEATFRLGPVPAGASTLTYQMRVTCLTNGVLRHPFVVMDSDGGAFAIRRFNKKVDTEPMGRYCQTIAGMRPKLRDYTKTALRMLPSVQRPERYRQLTDIDNVSNRERSAGFFGYLDRVPEPAA